MSLLETTVPLMVTHFVARVAELEKLVFLS
jgi:hypothetical protein